MALTDIAGGLLPGGSGSSSIDISPLLNIVKQNAARQKQILGQTYANLPSATDLRTNLLKAQDTGATAANARAGQFLSDISKGTNLQGQQLSDILKQKVMQNIPQATAAAKESLAATGGLERGFAGKTLAAIPQQAVSDIAQGQQQIQEQTQQATNNALNQVYNLDEQYIQDRTGLDKDTLTQIYQSGRQDLIDQANSLLGIEGNEANSLVGLNEFQIQTQLAQEQAAQQRRNQLLSALTGLGGTLVGAGVGGQVGRDSYQAVG